jgi:hypothetical protein
MTTMDKKINELNKKLGRKTGIDFKESIKVAYTNKPIYYGIMGGLSAFIFTSTGLVLSVIVGAGIGYGVKTFKD